MSVFSTALRKALGSAIVTTFGISRGNSRDDLALSKYTSLVLMNAFPFVVTDCVINEQTEPRNNSICNYNQYHNKEYRRKARQTKRPICGTNTRSEKRTGEATLLRWKSRKGDDANNPHDTKATYEKTNGQQTSKTPRFACSRFH